MPRHHLPPALLEAATRNYRFAGRFAWQFARGKLRIDPAFAGLLAGGWVAPKARVLDLGCGQGLLASLLLAVDEAVSQGAWPAAWGAAPVGCTVRGIELMPKDVQRAQTALAAHTGRVTVEQGDITRAAFSASDAVVILDVLHYMPFAAQQSVLEKAHACLVPGGRLLLRVGDKAAGLPHRLSNWVDKVVFIVRGHASSALYCRSVAEWQTLLAQVGFASDVHPMHAGTPFASTLFVAEKLPR